MLNLCRSLFFNKVACPWLAIYMFRGVSIRVFAFTKLNVHSLSKLLGGSTFFINDLNLGEIK